MNAIRSSRPAVITITIVVAAVLAAFSTIVVVNQEDKDVTVTAYFNDASPLVPGNVVKASGVDVGKITDLAVHDGKARVEMKVDPAVLPLHQDARAIIQPVSLLGERHIELKRGSSESPSLGEHPVISADRTERSVDLGDVLNSVDDPTGTALAAMVTTLGEGTRGRGADIAAAVKALRPSLGRTHALARTLNQQNGLLTHLLDNVQPVAGAIAADGGRRLDRLVGSAETTLSAVADRRQALKSALHDLPSTLTTAQRTLGRLAGVADSGATTLKSLRPVTGNLKNISSEVRRLADAMQPALASARPVLRRGQALLDEAGPLARALQPAGPYLRGVAGSARPLVEGLDARFRDILDFVKFWAMSTNGYDGISHYFRGHVVDTPQDVAQIPGVPMPTKKPALPKLGAAAGGLLKPVLPGSQPGNATGLTPQQENSLVGQLLGGQ